MRTRDLLTPIGITIGFIMIMLAILSDSGGEGVTSFIDITSIFIVIGGLTGSMLITFKFDQIKHTGKIIQETMYKNDMRLPELIRLFVELSEEARRKGVLALENKLDTIDDAYLKKGVLLLVDGLEPEDIKDIMEAEITAMEERHYQGRTLLEKAGAYAPAWGMIGTLIGLILMLNRLSDPASLGPSMAVALITTLYGIVLANLVFLPMAAKLEAKSNEEIFIRQIIIEGVVGIQSGQNPRLLEEKLSAFLSHDSKNELDVNIYNKDTRNVGDR
ncbi:flagellar motor protein MotP [Oceanobacillus sp. CAU 1775]